MPAKRKPMRKIKDVIRLKYSAGLSHRQIAAALNISIGVVSKYLTAAEAAGLSWPLPEDITERELERIIFSPQPVKQSGLVLPEFDYIGVCLANGQKTTLRIPNDRFRLNLQTKNNAKD